MPSRGYLWNLSRWVTRLGFNRDDVPEIAYAVQPVVIVGDHSAVTTPMRPAFAMVGGVFTPAAGLSWMFTWRTSAPGGCWLKNFIITAISAEEYQFQIATGNQVFSAELDLPPVNMGTLPVAGVGTLGSVATASADDRPMARTINSLAYMSELYLAPGEELRIQMTDLATASRIWCMVRDVPVAIPGP